METNNHYDYYALRDAAFEGNIEKMEIIKQSGNINRPFYCFDFKIIKDKPDVMKWIILNNLYEEYYMDSSEAISCSLMLCLAKYNTSVLIWYYTTIKKEVDIEAFQFCRNVESMKFLYNEYKDEIKDEHIKDLFEDLFYDDDKKNNLLECLQWMYSLAPFEITPTLVILMFRYCSIDIIKWIETIAPFDINKIEYINTNQHRSNKLTSELFSECCKDVAEFLINHNIDIKNKIKENIFIFYNCVIINYSNFNTFEYIYSIFGWIDEINENNKILDNIIHYGTFDFITNHIISNDKCDKIKCFKYASIYYRYDILFYIYDNFKHLITKEVLTEILTNFKIHKWCKRNRFNRAMFKLLIRLGAKNNYMEMPLDDFKSVYKIFGKTIDNYMFHHYFKPNGIAFNKSMNNFYELASS